MTKDELGFNAPEVYYDGPDRLRIIEGVAETGAGWIRIEAPWQELTSSTAPGWPRLDIIVNAAVARGLKVLMMICHGPSNKTVAGFAAVCKNLATRYVGRVSHFEIWNEENLHTFWPWASAKSFTPYLKAGYTAIKSVQPGSFVLLGGLAACARNPWYYFWFKNEWPVDFLKGVYAAGGKGYFDGVANHPYPNDAGFRTVNPAQDQLFMKQDDAIRNLMIVKGDGEKPIWWTEIGSDRLAVQVADLRTLFECYEARPHVTKFFIHNYRDLNDETFGLVNKNYVPRPSLDWAKGLLP